MNMKKINLLIFLLVLPFFSSGNMPGEKKLQFKEDRTFKIVQFTDTHYNHESSKSEVVIENIRKILKAENPDLVIFTGDIVTHAPVSKGWQEITAPLVEREIHWCVTLGNHDEEHDKSRKEILNLLANISYNHTRSGASNIYGWGNYVLKIKGHQSDKTEVLIYCMDSNAYTPIEGVGTYGWFQLSQINWYVETSNRHIRRNNGKPLPALAFFHIPLPEYVEAWNSGDRAPIGVKNEEVCAPAINTGMYAAMLQQGDVMATFAGHDHVNDYVAPLHGLAMIYGRFSGGGDTYGDLRNGARVIEITEGERAFITWIRLREGEKLREVKYKKDHIINLEP